MTAPASLRRAARYLDPSRSLETLANLRAVARRYDAGFPATMAHFLKLHLAGRYRRVEIFRLGIADPATPPEVLRETMSTVRAIQLQRKINPRDYDNVVEDKGVQYTYCKGASLPTPRLYAIFDHPCGWIAGGAPLDGRDAWVRFLRDEMPDRFVIKPARGQQGRMVRILSRDGEGFVDPSGRHHTAADLVDLMSTNRDYDRFVIQQRAENHPDLAALTGTDTLQTVRIVTGIGPRGEPRILFAAQRLAGASNSVDNFHYGETGNGVAALSLDDGAIVKAVIGTGDGYEMKDLETHPTTGRPLAGFRVPHWQDAKTLATDAARKFLPLKTVGWDIAVTPGGPVIVEGNLWWGIGTFSALRLCGRFAAYARETIAGGGNGRLA